MKISDLSLWLLIMRKKDERLHFLNLGGWSERNELMINIFKKSLGANNIKDFPAVIINTRDRPINKYFKLNVFSFTTASGYYDKIVPDWTYDSWMECKIPEFNVIIKEIEKAGKLNPKINKIGWIGNFNTHPSRLKLARLSEKYPQYLDIKDSNNTEYMSLPDLVGTYKYLIDVEGFGFSGRLKYLFFSGRPVFVQERFRKEYALLGAIPYKDYIPLKNDFSDLIEKINNYFNSDLINEIGKSGQKFAIKNLGKERACDYIRKEFKNLRKIRFNILKIIFFVLICLMLKLFRILFVRLNFVKRKMA